MSNLETLPINVQFLLSDSVRVTVLRKYGRFAEGKRAGGAGAEKEKLPVPCRAEQLFGCFSFGITAAESDYLSDLSVFDFCRKIVVLPVLIC